MDHKGSDQSNLSVITNRFSSWTIHANENPSTDQIQESLAPNAVDTNGAWRACKVNHSACDASQMKFLQGQLN
jgi:hypothetical protein